MDRRFVRLREIDRMFDSSPSLTRPIRRNEDVVIQAHATYWHTRGRGLSPREMDGRDVRHRRASNHGSNQILGTREIV